MTSQRSQIRLFKNELAERLSHVHPITPLVIWVPVIVYFFYQASMVDQIGAAKMGVITVSGILTWTLVEYLLHRFFFHIEPEQPILKRFFYIIHGCHHDDPNDGTRLVMPPFASIILGTIFYLTFTSVLGAVYGGAFFGAFLVGYLIYDYIHYATHHFTPKTWIGRKVKQHHMIHHFADHDAKWGVSSPLWDYVFGTLEPRQSSATPSHSSHQSKEKSLV